MLCGAQTIYEIANRQNMAVGAFTVVTREEIQGVIQAAEDANVPVILQASPFQLEAAGLEALAAEMIFAAQRAKVPVMVQLDHAKEFEVVCRCIRNGFSSVMIDGSLLPYEDNVALTRKVVEVAHAAGVSVEGELGHVGGTEDDVTTISTGLSDPDQAIEFAAETGIDALAIAIGTAHGLYRAQPNIDFDRLQSVTSRTKVPVVLHGGSGLSPDVIRRTITLGIRKINIGSELKLAHTRTLRDFLTQNREEIDPRKYLATVREAVRDLAAQKIALFLNRTI